MKLYLIRHGQTDWNLAGRIQGVHDIPLNETGLRQAEMAAKGMESRKVAAVYCSNLQRAAQTAAAVAKRQNVPVHAVDGLEEMNFGLWEGCTWKEIEEQYPNEKRAMDANPMEVRAPEGESYLDVMKRSVEALKKIASENKEDVAVVTHGGVIASIVATLFQENPENTEMGIVNASITTLEYNHWSQDFALAQVGDASHLAEM